MAAFPSSKPSPSFTAQGGRKWLAEIAQNRKTTHSQTTQLHILRSKTRTSQSTHLQHAVAQARFPAGRKREPSDSLALIDSPVEHG